MGNTTSCDKQLDLYRGLFGEPKIDGNHFIWDRLSKARMLGNRPVVFKKIVFVCGKPQTIHSPSDHDSRMFAELVIDIPDAKLASIYAISDAMGYDRITRSLWVHGQNIGEVIVLCRIAARITAAAPGSTSNYDLDADLKSVVGNEYGMNPDAVKGAYGDLVSLVPVHEGFSLYSDGPDSMNIPGNIYKNSYDKYYYNLLDGIPIVDNTSNNQDLLATFEKPRPGPAKLSDIAPTYQDVDKSAPTREHLKSLYDRVKYDSKNGNYYDSYKYSFNSPQPTVVLEKTAVPRPYTGNLK